MKLSELKTGEKAVIVKVNGHGGFRKRIIEMGFIKGKTIEAQLNAPLQDPVKYKIMGYEVSLRHNEAQMIEIITEEEAKNLVPEQPTCSSSFDTGNGKTNTLTDDQLLNAALQQRKTINVALVGNPNCGKTSFFNFASGAHERVGNYSGVTVDAKEGVAHFDGYRINLVDLPGTYSLSAYSAEELYVRKQLVEHTPDVVINVIDTGNLERNLYLTTQLIDMHLCMVCALNMYDEAEKRGDRIDHKKLGELLGMPMVPTVFKTGRGVEELFRTVIKTYETREEPTPLCRHLHIHYGHEIEHGIENIQQYLKEDANARLKYSTRYLALKLLETDSEIEQYISTLGNAQNIIDARNKAAARVKEETNEDSETAIMDAKYGFIHGALQESGYETGKDKDTYQATHFIDKLITNRILGFPIFIVLIWLMFEATFKLGRFPMDWIETGVNALGVFFSNHLPQGPLKDLMVTGIIGGVGSVIIFLPQILILYAFISYMEDSGYMARAAFIMDKLMHKMGLHGKSFIPLIMGFGCNVPAVMATRTIESRRSRLITMLVLPMMSCSARMPIYIMIVGTFFTVQYQSTVMISIYLIGILMGALVSRLFSKFVFKGEDTPFVMELPPYRFPTWKAIGRHTWEKGKQYLKKMGGVILVASIIVWALGYFPHNDKLTPQQQQEESYIGQMGKAVEPIFKPQGFDWKLDVSLLAGVMAKEIVASTMGVLYTGEDKFSSDEGFSSDHAKYTHLHAQMTADGITPLTAYAYLVFILLYFPCLATIIAIKNESGSWKWALFGAVYTTALAWLTSAAVYQVGSLCGL